MLGEEILPRRRGIRRGSVDGAGAGAGELSDGLAFERRETERRGVASSRPTGPMPSWASRADLSKGLVVNSDVVGDMMPKLSAASKSGEGCRGVRWNSSCRGDCSASVGVVGSGAGSFRLRFRVGGFLLCLGSADSGSTNIGTTGTIRPAGLTYAVPGFTALIARARCPGSLTGHDVSDGAEDGPGENAGIESDD